MQLNDLVIKYDIILLGITLITADTRGGFGLNNGRNEWVLFRHEGQSGISVMWL